MGVWLGGICLLSFVVAPGAFGTLASRDQAGAMVGFTLGRLHLIGIGAGVIYLVAHFLRASQFPSAARIAAVAVLLMIVLTAVSQFYVAAHMADLRQQMGSIERTPADSPLFLQFDRLHHVSVWLEGAVLLIGLAALFFTVKSA